MGSVAEAQSGPPGGYNWTGLYVGVHGGRSFNAIMDPQLEDPPAGPPTQHPNGWFGGGQIAYDWQLPSNVVFGVIVDLSIADMTDRQPDGNFIKQYSEIDYFGTARVRLGYAQGRFLPYVTGGLAWARLTYGETCPDGAQFGFCRPAAAGPYDNHDTNTVLGWALGGGVRIAITDQWSLGGEYLHIDLGRETFALGFSSTGRKVTDKPNETEFDLFRIALDYRF